MIATTLLTLALLILVIITLAVTTTLALCLWAVGALAGEAARKGRG